MNKTLTRLASAAAATTVAGTGFVIAAAAPAQAADSVWDKVAYCESTNRWDINTGNGFYGGLQFTQSTWNAYGGQEFAARADLATKSEQILVAQRVLAGQGPGAWPVCSVKAGLTRENGGATSYTKSSTTSTKVATTTSKPAAKAAPAKKPVAKAPVKKAAPKKSEQASANAYTVKAGDTLWKIAQAHGIENWQSIYALNKDQINNPDLIYVGQRFILG